jgi:hypothetical protein
MLDCFAPKLVFANRFGFFFFQQTREHDAPNKPGVNGQ